MRKQFFLENSCFYLNCISVSGWSNRISPVCPSFCLIAKPFILNWYRDWPWWHGCHGMSWHHRMKSHSLKTYEMHDVGGASTLGHFHFEKSWFWTGTRNEQVCSLLETHRTYYITRALPLSRGSSQWGRITVTGLKRKTPCQISLSSGHKHWI